MQVDLSGLSEPVRQLLKNKLRDWRDSPDPIWNSTWPVFERLIARHDEMKPVYEELANRGVTGHQLWNLLEQFIFAGSFSTEENHASLRTDYQELTELNVAIGKFSNKLATMIERRSEILNQSGHFYCERMVSLTALMDEAAKDNGHYTTILRGELEPLQSYDLKYWPSIQDILHVMGQEEVTVGFTDDATEAIINARRPSLTDYFRQLFDHINELKGGFGNALPQSFKLSDSALATVCNITRELKPEDMIDAAYVKRTRHRLKDQGFVVGW